MLTVYLIAMLVGGVLVGTSMIFGGHDADADFDAGADADADFDAGADADADFDAGADADADFDAGADADADAGFDADADGDLAGDHETSHGDSVGTWLPFLSLRFWTFFAAFFGLTGVVLHLFGLNSLATSISALGVGATTGTMVSWLVRRIKMAQTDSTVRETEIEGATARVLLPISPNTPGKIRVNMKGTSVDIAAATHEGETIPRGAEVLVVRMGDGEAVVTPMGAKDGTGDALLQRRQDKQLGATRHHS